MRRFAILLAAMLFGATPTIAQNVFDAKLVESDQKTADVSTNELRRIVDGHSATLLDARPPLEFSISHIPSAQNVAPQPGRPAHLYVSDVVEVGRLLNGSKGRPLVLYCNGPFCGKSKRLAAELTDAGYTNVRRYQLGTPGWRALAGAAMQTEVSALRYIRADATAVWVDARESSKFTTESIPGARNISVRGLKPGKDQGVVKEAKDDGRLPMDDHNTRIVVFGASGKDAQAVADAIAREAFHNVSFVAVPFEEVRDVLASK